MNVKALIKPVTVLAAVFVLLLALLAGLAPTVAENAATGQARLFDTLLPSGALFTEEAYNGEDTAIAAAHRGSTGYIVEAVTAGYAGDITMLAAVNFDDTVVGAVVREMEEASGLGAETLSDVGFLSQLIWSRGELAVGGNVGALTGATTTSKTVAKAVNSASASVTGADVSSSAAEWGGWAMQEKYTLNTALAAVVGLGYLAAVLYRVFLSAAVLPAVGPPAAAACSPLALVAEAYLSKGVPCRNWGLTLLLGALTFGLLPWAAGLTIGTEAVRFAVIGGAVFGALTFLFTSLRERLASGSSGRLVPLITASILFLACQCFAGMLL